ncbi:FAD-binding oxidoreductase [Dactylosporangium aurantiacum]|uniref:FAD-binding oxidoreductase n=1 Tax=Dactylosporangium aurantiacum TaxID=35754 RepID=A0A9Q9MHE8_9ACTN|nr:FAD-binding oxidoreductase [Dactylosporangium aurantiacum]MDG6104332.1 FAD-binding oxidoreductase [Dactylosporangium aurantiacum]UWZ56679.1 FAD-binding oxidoreductase [Dactylosporangium aurantiacum]
MTAQIAGVPAAAVATPASTAEVADVVRGAADGELALVVRGGGTRQDWALPPQRLDLIVETSRLCGLVEHAAGDLVVVVRAGTPLRQVQEALRPAGQQLALDEPLPGATVGGTVAVNASGPRRMLYGTVRDLLIGVTVVRADGVVAKAGGKVVKNVAGYDLGKLVAGSYGTLGVITECAFRLHPLPAARRFVSVRVDGPEEAGRALSAVLGAQVVPSALEIDTDPLTVTALVEGVPAGVAQRAADLEKLLGEGTTSAETPPPGWGAYPWGPGDVGIKLTSALSRVPYLLTAAGVTAQLHDVALHVRGSAGTGVLYAGLPGDTDPGSVVGVVSDLRAATRAGAGHCVVLTAPPAIRSRVDVWGHVDGLDLMRRVKEQFDPLGILAPGRFVGGI